MLYAFQAHKVTSWARGCIVDCMLDYAAWVGCDWGRTRRSLLIEWTGHDELSFVKRCKDINFDRDEEGMSVSDYYKKAATESWNSVVAMFRKIGLYIHSEQ